MIEILQRVYANNDLIHGKNPWQVACRENDKRINWHRSKEYPVELLGVQRPNEEPLQKLYRALIYNALGSKTYPYISSIVSALHRIRQSEDFKIQFESSEFKDTGIPPENSLEAYLKEKVPLYTNLEDWSFGPCIDAMIWNPNAFITFLPELDFFKRIDPENEFYDENATSNPYPRIYEAKNVVWVDPEFAMFETGKYRDRKDDQEVICYVAITKEKIALIERRPIARDGRKKIDPYKSIYDWSEILPVCPVGHLIDQIVEEKKVYKSVITNGLSNLNTAAQISDDQNVNRAYHVHPKLYEINPDPCRTCEGQKWIAGVNNTRVACTTCYGSGYATETPMNAIRISLDKFQPDENGQMPNLPALPWGKYLERPIEIFEALEKSFENEVNSFFGSNNIEFLNEEPLNESGKAKEVDKEEVHTFFYPNAVQIAAIYEFGASCFYAQLYRPQIDNGLVNSEKVKKALPKITVPSEFNIQTMAALAESLALRIDKKMDYSLIQGGTVDLLRKQFGENSVQVMKYCVKSTLDPLVKMTADEKAAAYLDRAISQFDYCLSTMFDYFIEDAVEQDKNFYKLTRKEQKDILKTLVDAEVMAINKNIVAAIDVNPGLA
jgi:hypothetical protein